MNIAGWEDLYRKGQRGAEAAPTALLVETIQNQRPGRAADFACGTGRHALYLARKGWRVAAIDGSQTAIKQLEAHAAKEGLAVEPLVSDLTRDSLTLAPDSLDLAVVAYYLQRDLYPELRKIVRPGGMVVAIAHLPESGEEPTEKRVAPGELRSLFEGWEIVHDYEGPSRDPAHRRPVAEISARRPLNH